MRNFILVILMITTLAACNNSGKKNTETGDTTTTKEKIVTELSCFEDPDTSLGKMNISDPGSVQAIIRDDSKPDSLGEYHFYSKNHDETLTLVQHPGDISFSISIFKVEASNKAEYGYEKLEDESFVTGKGIKRGMSKEEIISKLGTCYTAKDSAADHIELYYRIEAPKDTKNGLLTRHNMPIYYASYQLSNNKLWKFEFGFEYP